MKKSIFTGSGVALVTPMNSNGDVNYTVLRDFTEWQIANHTDALIVCGTTGEASTLTNDERSKSIQTVIEQTARRVPVIAGTGSNDTAKAVFLSKQAQYLGADALLLVTPYYNKTTQNGLIEHYTTIADQVNIPCILYNVPSRTGVNISPETYAKLANHPNIVATKEASGNIAQTIRIRHLCGDNLDVYSGNDDMIVPMLSLGAKGVISVMANAFPQEVHELCNLYISADPTLASRRQIEYMPIIDALFSVVNPIPIKEMLNIMGWQMGQCRLPLDAPTDKLRELLSIYVKKREVI